MKIIVSACLLGENCKYNGGNNRCLKVLDFVKDHEVIPVCPEQMGGLFTPRLPAEIRNGEVVNAEGTSVDTEFRKGAEAALEIAQGKVSLRNYWQNMASCCWNLMTYEYKSIHCCPKHLGQQWTNY